MMRNDRDWLPFWSIPTGSFLGIRLSVSLLVPLLIPVFCYWFGLRLGCSISAILLLSVIIHEIARILVCNACGEPPTRSALWPAGSLNTAHSSRCRILGALAGMGANLLVCLITALPLYQDGSLWTALDPVLLTEFQLSENPTENIVYLLCALNWTLVLVNLIPLTPFSMGVVFRELSEKLFGSDQSEVIWERISWCLASILLLAGLILELPLVVGIAAVSMLSIMTLTQEEIGYEPEPKETFLGYDFSEGYTSLDRSNHPVAEPPSLLQRWRERREQQRQLREAELDLEVEQNLDRILEQVHLSGVDSLEPYDRSILDRASERFRTRSDMHKSSEVK